MSQAIGAEGFLRNVALRNDFQTYVSRSHDCICQNRKEISTGIIIAVVAQQVDDALALFVQAEYVEMVTAE
jgi:hypothetical protein